MDVRAEYFARFGSVENLRELLDAGFTRVPRETPGKRMVLGGEVMYCSPAICRPGFEE